jgi:NRPS condensation-like uncharacterized protein
VTPAPSPIPSRFPAVVGDQASYVLREVADQQVRMVLSFSGRLDEERLARAVRLTLDAEPVLGCRFVERAFKPFWQRRDDLDEVGLGSVEKAGTAGSKTEPSPLVLDFLTAPSDPGTDPLVQYRLVRGRADTLCLRLDHAVGDAAGLKDYAYLLATTYRRLGANHGFIPAPNVNANRGLRRILKQYSLASQRAAMRRSSAPRARWFYPWKGDDRGGRRFAVRTLSVDRLTAARALGIARRATVNDVLLTAYHRALSALTDQPAGVPLAVQVPVDLRHYLPQERAGTVCNLSAMMYPAVPTYPSESFDDTLAAVVAETGRLKQGDVAVGVAAGLAVLFGAGFAVGRRALTRMFALPRSGFANPILSNTGIIDADRLAFDGVAVKHAYVATPVEYPPGVLLGVSSFAGTLTLSLGYCEASCPRADIERLLDLIVAELPA